MPDVSGVTREPVPGDGEALLRPGATTTSAAQRRRQRHREKDHRMNGLTTPQFVQAILEWRWTWPIARFALVVTLVASGLRKIANFSGGVAEMAEAGMPAPVAMALLSNYVELTSSVLALIGRWVWLGAGMLGVFTASPRFLEGFRPGTERSDRSLPRALWADRRFCARRPSRRMRRWPMKSAHDRRSWRELGELRAPLAQALLAPERSVLLLIDHQPFQFSNLHSHEPTLIINNVVGLAKAAKAFKVPRILTTVTEERVVPASRPPMNCTAPATRAARSRRSRISCTADARIHAGGRSHRVGTHQCRTLRSKG
jgi:hypothetical protein